MDNFTNLMKIWFKKPAKKWTEAIPLGNGRIGAMVYGKTDNELIELNEDTLWAGYPKDLTNKDAMNYLDKARNLIFNGEISKAEDLVREKMIGTYMQPYQPLADLQIAELIKDKISDYKRELNLNNAICSINYKRDNLEIRREYFISAVDQAFIGKISCPSKKKILNLEFSLASKLQYRTDIKDSKDPLNIHLILNGQAPSYVNSYRKKERNAIIYDKNNGMKFQVRFKIFSTDGKIDFKHGSISVNNASFIEFSLVAATSFNGYNKHPVKEGKNSDDLCYNQIREIDGKNYETMKQNHINDYSELFQRVDINFGSNMNALLPTDKRIRRLKNKWSLIKKFLNIGIRYVFNKNSTMLEKDFITNSLNFDDPQLIALYFQFGRYLMISSSRKGTQPANLQGIWCNQVQPPWASNYTININTEMNYWLVEVCNLSECQEPLLKMIGEIA